MDKYIITMDDYVINITGTLFGRVRVARVFIATKYSECPEAEINFLKECETNDDFCNYYFRRDRVDFGIGKKIIEIVMSKFSPKIFEKMVNMKKNQWRRITASRGSVATTFRIFPRYDRHVHEFELPGWFSNDFFMQRNFYRENNSKFSYALPDAQPGIQIKGNIATLILDPIF